MNALCIHYKIELVEIPSKRRHYDTLVPFLISLFRRLNFEKVSYSIPLFVCSKINKLPDQIWCPLDDLLIDFRPPALLKNDGGSLFVGPEAMAIDDAREDEVVWPDQWKVSEKSWEVFCLFDDCNRLSLLRWFNGKAEFNDLILLLNYISKIISTSVCYCNETQAPNKRLYTDNFEYLFFTILRI